MEKAIFRLPGLSIFLFIFFNSAVFSQVNLGPETIIDVEFSPKEYKIGRPEPKPFRKSVKMENSSMNSLFFKGVGGVSFDQSALPEDSLDIVQFSLNYNSSKTNGSRLEIKINRNDVGNGLPDWMLIPIAKYADSPYFSCFTLFGKLQDTSLANSVLKNEGRVMNYHPSLDNTLLGLRLSYIDMLIGYVFTTDLPKDKNDRYILGYGEKAPDLYSNKLGRSDLSRHMIEVENKYGLTFRSYIICDYNQNIKFDLLEDSLTISGNPHFYCWRHKMDNPDYDINKVYDEMLKNYQKELDEQKANNNTFNFQDWVIEKTLVTIEKYDGNYDFYKEGTIVDLIKMNDRNKQISYLKNYEPQSIFNIMLEMEAYMDAYKINYLEDYSNDLSGKVELFEASNPAVWNATVNTMRYAAFFRYCKAQYPDEWRRFMIQVQDINPDPVVKTPTVIYPVQKSE